MKDTREELQVSPHVVIIQLTYRDPNKMAANSQMIFFVNEKFWFFLSTFHSILLLKV